MKYFKYELWELINSEDSTIEKQASEQWNINHKLYFDEFIKLENKVSPEQYQVFKQIKFHDYTVKNYSISEYEHSNPKPLEVSITVSDGFSEEYIIDYRDVKKFSLHLQYDTNYELGEWGYDEILIEDEGVISHEILLSSGTTILIHFTDVTVSKLNFN